jgi:putative addiction module component (TIGR02574 family)
MATQTRVTVADIAAVLKRAYPDLVARLDADAGGHIFGVVVSEQFAGVPHIDRQDALWQVLRDGLPRGSLQAVRIILASTPNEEEALNLTDSNEAMMTSTAQIKSQFAQLPVRAQLELLYELWDEVGRRPDAHALSEGQRDELDRRYERHVANPGGARSWDEVKTAIRRDR